MQITWEIENSLVDYSTALVFMEEKVSSIINRGEADMVWLLEHPHIYTAGTSANAKDLLQSNIPVYETGRGGQYTYHGPKQRIAYVMLDLKRRNMTDVRKYIYNLEEWIIKTLEHFKVKGERREGRVGIWVVGDNGEENKIAAIGVRIRKWVTYHGISINIDPDLSYYNGIVPCGIAEHGITSLAKLGVNVTMAEFDTILQQKWGEVF